MLTRDMTIFLLFFLSMVSFSSEKNCTELMQEYNGKLEIPRPLERFAAPSQALYDALKLQDPKEIIEYMLAKDTRGWIFRLEGLLKLYKSKKKRPHLLDLYNKIKSLEDSIGAYDAFLDWGDFAKKAQAPAPVIDYFNLHTEKSYENLVTKINQEWNQEGFHSFIETLSKHEWKSYKKDKAFIRKKLIKELEDLELTQYEFNQLEEGVHEFRRDIRWIPIYAHALQGLIHFTDDAGKSSAKAFNQLLENQKLRNSPYVIYEESPKETSPMTLSLPYYLALSYVIGAIGKIKDNGQYVESLAHAYLELGLSSSFQEAEEQIHSLPIFQEMPFINWEVETTKLYHYLKQIPYDDSLPIEQQQHSSEEKSLFKLLMEELKEY